VRGSNSQLTAGAEVSAGEWTTNAEGRPPTQTTGIVAGAGVSMRAGTGTDGESRGAGVEAGVASPGVNFTRSTTTDGNGQPISSVNAGVNMTPGMSVGAYGNTGPNENRSSDVRARASVGVGTGFGVRAGQTDVDQDGVRETCVGVDVEWFSGDLCVEGGAPGQSTVDHINRVAAREEAERRLARGLAPGEGGATIQERRINAAMVQVQRERQQAAARQAAPNPNDPMNRTTGQFVPLGQAERRPGDDFNDRINQMIRDLPESSPAPVAPARDRARTN